MVDPGTFAHLEQSAQIMHRTAEGMLRVAKTARGAGYSAFADRMEGRAREMLRLTDDFDPDPFRPSTLVGNGCDPGLDPARLDGMDNLPGPADLSPLEAKYGVSSTVLEDLYARRRAGARDAELVNLLTQADRGGLDADRARALVSELPQR